MLSRLISRVPRRQFSKYIEDNYGKEVHRLANRPGIEVSPLEVFVYACGSFLLVADVSRSLFYPITLVQFWSAPQMRTDWTIFYVPEILIREFFQNCTNVWPYWKPLTQSLWVKSLDDPW